MRMNTEKRRRNTRMFKEYREKAWETRRRG